MSDTRVRFINEILNADSVLPRATFIDILGENAWGGTSLMWYDKNSQYEYRQQYIDKFGFTVITKEILESLIKNVIGDKKVLEVMAGSGYVSKYLADYGIDVIATDNYSGNKYRTCLKFWESHINVEKLSALDAVLKYGKDRDVLYISWIPYESDMGLKIMKAYLKSNPNGTIILVGEDGGGCTGTEKDFDWIYPRLDDKLSLTINDEHLQFTGIHDEFFILKNKE